MILAAPHALVSLLCPPGPDLRLFGLGVAGKQRVPLPEQRSWV